MNTLNTIKLQHQLNCWKLNSILIPIIITLGLVSNIIGHRMILIFGVAMYSGAFLKLAALVLLNVIRSYSANNRTFLLTFILGILLSFVMTGYAQIISQYTAYPDYFKEASAYSIVFSNAWHSLVAGAISTLLFLLIELILFNFFYFKMRFLFILASTISIGIALCVASNTTLYLGFVLEYPQHIETLLFDNLIRNLIVLIILSLLIQPLVYWINHKYLQS
ncbi:hypothetical protein [Fangia hongkongensis]|uniref:hypothetical protein n=1 Tax=Fangia hongkongensis TaxID=270495 RepID=UPI00036C926B|nr:hypothetical protein [Fangia hongkongensis]MBK2125929.1 hypothetical protein [Fangia hongkongensis]